jgi:hypothetical protein
LPGLVAAADCFLAFFQILARYSPILSGQRRMSGSIIGMSETTKAMAPAKTRTAEPMATIHQPK